MSSDFWAKAIGGIARPAPPQQQPPQQGPWWQDGGQPQYPPQQQYPQQQYHDPYGQPAQPYPQGYNPALAAQMPGQYPGQQGQQGRDQYIAQLKRIPADQLNQAQMEEIAQYELDTDHKFNQSCPQCGSANFIPAGMVLGGKRMGSDKCFDCGASSSTYTSSPEPARGGSQASKAPYRDVRQIDTGGAGGASMYLKFRGIPNSYVPRT